MFVKNSDRFLFAFNRIDHRLKEIAGAKSFLPFYRLVDQSKKKDAIVRKYEDDLRAFADLRNAIVHHRTALDYVIAEPHDEIVDRIEQLDVTLSRPTHVGKMFRKRVRVFQIQDSLHKVLKTIHNRQYTQFPIYEGKQFRGLLTTVGITNWFANRINHGKLSHKMPTIGDILEFEKRRVNYKFISRYMTVYEAEELFKQGVESGKRFEALLITEHGKKEQKLIGMITPLDIMKIE